MENIVKSLAIYRDVLEFHTRKKSKADMRLLKKEMSQ